MDEDDNIRECKEEAGVKMANDKSSCTFDIVIRPCDFALQVDRIVLGYVGERHDTVPGASIQCSKRFPGSAVQSFTVGVENWFIRMDSMRIGIQMDISRCRELPTRNPTKWSREIVVLRVL